MPGRGRPWREGGLPDNTVTSADIKQGTIVADDIDPTYRTLIEGGGGGIDRENIADPFTDFYLYDEFFYPTPSTYLDVHYEKIGTFTAPTNVIGGQVRFATGGQIDDIARINTCGAGLVAIDATKNFRLVFRVRNLQVDADTSILIGVYTDNGSKPGGTFPFSLPRPPYLFFRADGTGNWFAQTDDNSTPQSTDTGVTNDTAFHVFEIRSNPSTPSVEFLIDNNIVTTYTANLPTGLKALFVGVQSGAVTNKDIIIDSLLIYQER